MLKRVLFLAASLALALALAAPAAAYEEFTSETAQQRFAWARQAYPYYCDVPPPPQLRNLRFEHLDAISQWGMGFVSKQRIAHEIEERCGQNVDVSAYTQK